MRNFKTLFVSLVCLALASSVAFAQRFEKAFANVAEMLASNPNDVHTNAFLQGYYTPGDGGGGPVYYNRTSTATVDNGAYHKPTSYNGRWVAIFDSTTGINVKRFGAKGDNATDDTARCQAAINYAEALSPKSGIYFPVGKYIIDSLTTQYASIEGYVDAMFTSGSQNSGVWLIHKVPATGPLIRVRTPGTATSGRIRNLSLLGAKEQNKRNVQTISSVTTRTNFVVSSPGTLPTAPASPSVWPYYGYCFFYTSGDKYLGAGLVVGIDYGTGAISLAPQTDQYATVSGDSHLLTAGTKVSFSATTTEYASFKTTTGVDSTTAGYSGIDFNGDSPSTLITKWKVENVTVVGFHTGIRVGNVLANHFNQLWIRNCAFACIAGAFPGDNRDSFYNQIFTQGFYTTDSAGSVPTLDNQVFQRTLWGIYGVESSGNLTDITADHSVNGWFIKDCLETRVGSVLFDGPVNGHALHFHSGLSSLKRPQIHFENVLVRNGNEPTYVNDLGYPSYVIHVTGINSTYYIGSLYALRFATTKYYDAVFNQPFATRGTVENLWDAEGATSETLFSPGTTTYYPMILNQRVTDSRFKTILGGVTVMDFSSTINQTPIPLAITGTGYLNVGGRTTLFGNNTGTAIDSIGLVFRYGGDTGGTGVTRTDNTQKDAIVLYPPYTNSEPSAIAYYASSQQTQNLLMLGGGNPGFRPSTRIDLITGDRNTTGGTVRASVETTGEFTSKFGIRLGSSGGPKISNGTGAPTATDPTGSIYVRTDATPSLNVREGGMWYTIPAVIFGQVTWDIPSLTTLANSSTTTTVAGAITGDLVIVSPSMPSAGVIVAGDVTSANTITIRGHNVSGGTIDPPSATYNIRVIRQ